MVANWTECRLESMEGKHCSCGTNLTPPVHPGGITDFARFFCENVSSNIVLYEIVSMDKISYEISSMDKISLNFIMKFCPEQYFM